MKVRSDVSAVIVCNCRIVYRLLRDTFKGCQLVILKFDKTLVHARVSALIIIETLGSHAGVDFPSLN